MVVSFKKTAECQYHRNDHYWSSLGHRRLRFSFQINDFKDQDRNNRPHCLAPVSGGGGDLGGGGVPVKRPFRVPPKKDCGGPDGRNADSCPHLPSAVRDAPKSDAGHPAPPDRGGSAPWLVDRPLTESRRTPRRAGRQSRPTGERAFRLLPHY